MGCDGIFDKVENKDIVKLIWNTINNSIYENIHDFSGKAINNIIKNCFSIKSLDNLTGILISFKNLKNKISCENFYCNPEEILFEEMRVFNIFFKRTIGKDKFIKTSS